uniref:D-ribulose kinase n=1 Tax=Picocystis salinarum TaxID=88271 RepID=A0A7S3UGI4_9CHLO|mmetsp:Transcript_9953/g.60868  ORF Transcript_9953/g.60868 Transcript_9953/m.60868 type:complete len:478 (+) Transcript_9953:1775-3208(+)
MWTARHCANPAEMRTAFPRPSASTRPCVLAKASFDDPAFLGLDFGTSGARVCAIDDGKQVLLDVKRTYGAKDEDAKDPNVWKETMMGLLGDVPREIRERTVSIAIDGTSATALLVDEATGEVLTRPKMYNEAQEADVVERVKNMAPPLHTTLAATSTLCKLMAWKQERAWDGVRNPRLLHQADWLASLLHNVRSCSDWNNALKLGFEPAEEKYADWLLNDKELSPLLPNIVAPPGAPMAELSKSMAQRFMFPPTCVVCAGTTDSIAAFLAAGVTKPGEAVTSLGSTMAMKMISTQRVDNATYGVYSHRLGDVWLVGGASNTGGAVLRAHFTDDELAKLSEEIDPSTSSNLDYYPLPSVGERFPVCDPQMAPRMVPVPESRAEFLKAILEGIAKIEQRSYALLLELGASPLQLVVTCGGGAQNATWNSIRHRVLGVPVQRSDKVEAAYGSALLAMQGWRRRKLGEQMAASFPENSKAV